MNKMISTFLFALLSLTGCKDLDIAPGVPKCLTEKIKILEKKSFCKTGNSVKEYKFQDKTVYVLDNGSCYADSSAEVIDSDCNHLGQLGGLAGNEEINGLRFSSNATFVKIVWEN